MVPPWVPDVDSPVAPEGDDLTGVAPDAVSPPATPVPIAPAGRFGSTRRALGTFAQSGSGDAMRRGVGRYVATGLGGSGTASRRFGKTATIAGDLYRALGGTSSGPGETPAIDRDILAGRTAREVIQAVAQAACESDGTQDAEASQRSINDALSELLERHPEADVLSLSEEQREFVIERFVSQDVYRRFVLDNGKHIQDRAPSASSALSRLKEIKEYIRETVSASFRKLRESGTRLRGSRVSQIVQRALRDAFEVFAEYAE